MKVTLSPGDELPDHQKRERIRRQLDECWAEANDPRTQWVDGEEFMTRFEAEIDAAEKAESARLAAASSSSRS